MINILNLEKKKRRGEFLDIIFSKILNLGKIRISYAI